MEYSFRYYSLRLRSTDEAWSDRHDDDGNEDERDQSTLDWCLSTTDNETNRSVVSIETIEEIAFLITSIWNCLWPSFSDGCHRYVCKGEDLTRQRREIGLLHIQLDLRLSLLSVLWAYLMNKHEKLSFSLLAGGGRGAFPISTYPSLDWNLHTMWMRRRSFLLRCCSSSKTCHCSSSRLVTGENKTEGFSPCFRRMTAVGFIDEYIAQWERSKSSRPPCRATVETSVHLGKWGRGFLSRPERHDRSDFDWSRLFDIWSVPRNDSHLFTRVPHTLEIPNRVSSSINKYTSRRLRRTKWIRLQGHVRRLICRSWKFDPIDTFRRATLIYQLSTRVGSKDEYWSFYFQRLVVCCLFVNACT